MNITPKIIHGFPFEVHTKGWITKERNDQCVTQILIEMDKWSKEDAESLHKMLSTGPIPPDVWASDEELKPIDNILMCISATIALLSPTHADDGTLYGPGECDIVAIAY